MLGRMEVTSPDGTRIHYESYGDGPPLLFAHGSLMEGASWVEAGWVDALAGFRCVILDCRGYGASDKSHEPVAYATERYVDDFLAVAGAENIDRFGIVGFSFGTPGGWLAAARHPDRVAGLVAIGGWHPNLYSFELDVMEKTRIEPMQQQGVAGFAQLMKIYEGPLPEWWERQVLDCDPYAYIGQRYAAVNWTRLPPAEVKVPVLLISGSEEDTQRDSLLIAGALDDGDAVIVEGRGHCQTFLAREAIAATKNFFEKHLD